MAQFCPNISDPDFKNLQSSLAERGREYSDDELGAYLQTFREYYEYDYDWYPVTNEEYSALIWYIDNVATQKVPEGMDRTAIFLKYRELHDALSPEELEFTLDLLTRFFSSRVDALQKKEENIGKSRTQIIRELGKGRADGYTKIMRSVFDALDKSFSDPKARLQQFIDDNPNATEEEKKKALDLYELQADYIKDVVEHRSILASVAASRIGEEEGFVTTYRNMSVDFDYLSEIEDTEGVEDEPENNGEDVDEDVKGERYVDFRTVKLMETLSPTVKRFLRSIKKVDSNGKVVTNNLGFIQYLSPRQAAITLSKTLTHATPETMMQRLRDASSRYSWIKGLVSELEKNTDFQTQIYVNFKKAETTYVSVYKNRNEYKQRIDNSSAQGNSMSVDVGNNMTSGIVLDEDYSIYTKSGILASTEKIKTIGLEYENIRKIVQDNDGARFITMIEGDAPIKKKYIDRIIKEAAEAGKDASYLLLSPDAAMQGFLKANPGLTEKISRLLMGMGFDVSEQDIIDIATQKMTPKAFSFISGSRFDKIDYDGRNKLYQLVDWIGGVYGRAESIREGKFPATGQYLYNTSKAITYITNCLALTRYNDRETRVLSGSKSLSTYNNVNLLRQNIEMLSNSDGRAEQQYQDDLRDNYLQFEGMSLGYGEQMQATGWLKVAQENKGNIRSKFIAIDDSGFNNVEYTSLNDGQKAANALLKYLLSGGTFQDSDVAAYEVPIQADYGTAYNFVVAPRYSYSKVIDNLCEEVAIEIETMASIQERLGMPGIPHPKVLESQGSRFQIFPEFNTNGFLARYKSLGTAEAEAFLREQVALQMDKIIARDRTFVEKSGMLKNPLLSNVYVDNNTQYNFKTNYGKIASLDSEEKQVIDDFCANVFYARQQMCKIFTGGMEQFNGLLEYEKRNMLLHAPHSSLYTEATYKGKKVGKEAQNVLYIDDDESKSALYDDFSELLGIAEDDGIITKEQKKTMLGSFRSITTTDGVGFRTLDSHREVMLMSDPDSWTNRHEKAYWNIKNGNAKPEDIQVFLSGRKPVLTGYEVLPAASGTLQKPIKLTVLHKYAEEVLLPTELIASSVKAKAAPLQALARVNKALSEQKIDLFLFSSGVKVGAHTAVDTFAKEGNEPDGKRLRPSVKEMADYTVSFIKDKPYAVHTIPFKYYGIAASVPQDISNERISLASQAETAVWSGIKNEDYDGKGVDTVVVRGKEMPAVDARKTYYQIKMAEIVSNYKELRKQFANRYELERLLQEELAGKSYSSGELRWALTILKNHEFAVPLFSPGVMHQVEALFTSIMRKRLIKPTGKGANIPQGTSLGFDLEQHGFEGDGNMNLSVVFTGEGRNRRIKYVEVTVPLYDNRLKAFADKSGGISAERLAELVDEGRIDPKMLEFIGYRTPSDATHSIIPCRIKAFTSPADGSVIRMPKEIMKLTGHDYGGDKLRCHFPEFDIEYDDNKIQAAYDEYVKHREDINTGLISLGIPEADAPISYEEFYKNFISEGNSNRSNYTKVAYISYDYGKSAFENTSKARNNARIELMFSQLTSPAGSRKLVIPGGSTDTIIYAKAIELTRRSADEKVRNILVDVFVGQFKMERSEAETKVNNPVKLFNKLVSMDPKELKVLMSAVLGNETPFSFAHSQDAYNYIVRNSEMIGLYAMYSGAFQKLGRMEIRYKPSSDKTSVKILGHDLSENKLFSYTDRNGQLSLLTLAHLLNAAVDNAKDPVLGYLNQSSDMVKMTFFLLAAGISEEDLHLILNQPVVHELADRLKRSKYRKIRKRYFSVAKEIIYELLTPCGIDQQAIMAIKTGQDVSHALAEVEKMKRADFINNLPKSYSDIKSKKDYGMFVSQIALLRSFQHLITPADTLSEFVRLVRPDSESGSIGSSIASIIQKKAAINDFRQKMDSDEFSFTGMEEVLAHVDVHEGFSPEYLAKNLDTELPEVTALMSLLTESGLDIFRPYMPQAKKSWADVEARIASLYSYDSLQEGSINKVGRHMILWKLLSDKNFVKGNPQEEQKLLLFGDAEHKSVPTRLRELKERIHRAEMKPGTDEDADMLVGNIFLQNLGFASIQDAVNGGTRIQFKLTNPSLYDTTDIISDNWSEMLYTGDDEIKQLAIDLFKYSIYTNGNMYGKYEFSHFVPYDLLTAVPGYLDALNNILDKADWNETEVQNLIDQYYRNNWFDTKLVPEYKMGEFAVDVEESDPAGRVRIKKFKNDTVNKLAGHPYVTMTRGSGKEIKRYLFKVTPIVSGNPATIRQFVLDVVEPLGDMNFNKQIFLQYNPGLESKYVKKVVHDKEPSLGEVSLDNVYAEANIDAPGMQESNGFDGIVKDAETSAEGAAKEVKEN